MGELDVTGRGSSNAWTAGAFIGHRPRRAGDLSVESHGIAPIPEDQRYGTPARLFTVWFAPQVNMTGVFTGVLPIVLGLGFWLGLLSMAIGTVLGAIIVAYLSTWGPRTGAGQLPNTRMAFGGGVVLPGVLQWLSSIAWDALAALFGAEALTLLLGIPFWVAALIVLGAQGVVGFFGYELIHRLQAVMTVVLFTTFVVFAVKLVGGQEVVTPPTVSGADLSGAVVLEVTIAFSLAVSWASYAADFSRYLPSTSSPARVFGFTFAGVVLGLFFVEGIGIAAGDVVAYQTADGVRSVMGGGLLGGVTLLIIALSSVGSGVMTQYSGSLTLQTIGVRVRRPVSAVVVTVLALGLTLWLDAADTATRFQDAVLLVSYWIPGFVAVVSIDWLIRTRGRTTINPAVEPTDRRDAVAALIAFLLAYLAAIPFMNTTLIHGPIAQAWHGADIAYFVALLVAALLYGGYRLPGPVVAIKINPDDLRDRQTGKVPLETDAVEPMSSQGGGQRLRGRAGECETLRGLISTAQSATSQVLVLRGEAGVGKTALLEYTSELAAGFRCVQVAGVQADMELAFAGLQQLCAPLLNYLDELPEPQREALNVAFGRGVGAAPDRFLVGLAVLSLMAAAANDQPLLCVIDDAQWLDEASVQTLAFVARRLLAEPVAMVFAARDAGAEALAGLPELVIRGLPAAVARELLESVMPGGIDPRVRDRIVAETRGVPLAILEVPRSVSATELAGGFWIVGKRSSAAAIEDSYVRRIRSLPEQTQRLLLVAAAEPVGDAALFLRAAAKLGIPVDALAPAEADGIIEFGPRMRFHHPLMRSAAYRAAELTDRRAAHRALADATDPRSDPDRKAWHAANAAAGPDDAVAAELEASAGRAQSRGGFAAAAAFLERATTLTADPALRSARAIAAAQAKRDAAAPAAAYELLAIAELGRLSELQRAQIARLRAQMEFVRSRGGDTGAPRVSDTSQPLLDAAEQLENLDDHTARETYLEALSAAMYAGRLGAPDAVAKAAQAARAAVDRLPKSPRPVDFLLKGIAERISGGPSAGAGPLRAALELMCKQAHDGDVRRWMLPAFPILQESAAHELWDEAIAQQLSTAVVQHARDAGALAVLPQALVYRAGAHMFAGEFAAAARLIEEANSITAATDYYAPVRYHSLLLVAWRGDPEVAVKMIQAAAANGKARGEGRVIGLTGFATAVLYNGLARYEEAFVAARDAGEYEDLGFYGPCLVELIEAAARSGEQEASASALRRFEERAVASGTDYAFGVLASSRALLADDELAEGLYIEAIERLERTPIIVHRARAHLRYGEWLRRVNRRIDARRQLNEAHEMFVQMGAQAFAERARRELIGVGEKVRRQPVSSGGELTAQEEQIARLASDGLTNQEIGAQLFISTHTVEWHLRKVFVKLGITSRRQLRTVSWAS